MPFAAFPGSGLFRPMPGDEGPLTPEERAELIEFVRLRVPRVYATLKEVRERDPDAFEAVLQEKAPRLRQLRRIYEHSPDLGRKLIRHADNLQQIHQARRALRETEDDPAWHDEIEASTRQLVSKNLRIEIQVLTGLADLLDEQREERIAAEVERLRAADVTLADEPNDVRELVLLLDMAPQESERAVIEARLWDVCSQRMDEEVTRLRRHAQRLQENAADEIERRMQRLTRSREGRGPGGRGDHGRKGRPGTGGPPPLWP